MRVTIYAKAYFCLTDYLRDRSKDKQLMPLLINYYNTLSDLYYS